MKKLFLVLSVFALIFFFIACSKPAGAVSESDIPANAVKVNAKLNDGKIEFMAFYTEPAKIRHGESFKIISFWKFNEALTKEWKLFYHFYDEKEDQFFKSDKVFGDGKMDKMKGLIIRDVAVIKELPAHFDAQKLLILTGFWKDKERTKPETKYNDGKDRLKLPLVETDAPKIVKKSINAFVVASDSRSQIKIDGELKESFWKNAQTGGKFWLTNGSKIADSQTNVMVAIDNKYLYVGFDVEDKDIWSPYEKNDDKIYNHDVVEIFIDANGDKDEYYELQVSPKNIKFDCSFKGGPRKNQDVNWDSGMKYGVKLNGTLNNPDDVDKGYTVEMAIPFEAIKDAANNPPKDGDKWKIYIYRIDKNQKGESEYTGWIPPYANDFHNLRYMGDLNFVYEEIL